MANPNVLFKRGLQSALPSTVIDGAFYLTTDTHRLYVGQGTTPVLLNQTVQFVNSIAELTAKSADWTTEELKKAHEHDLYYVLPGAGDASNTQGGNILAVWCYDKTEKKYAWVQINPDHNTFVTDMKQYVSAVNNVATVRTTLTQNDGEAAKAVQFTVTGSGNTIDVNGADGNITLKGDTYTLSRPTNGEIKLSSALGQAASSVKLVAGANVTIENNASNANQIDISAHDTTNTSAVLSLDANGKLTVKVNDSDGGNVTASTENITMKYGSAGNLTAPIGGTLNVYSKADIDGMFKDLNGLTYVGTVGSNGTYTMGTDFKVYNGSTAINVHNGDMFLVAGDVKYGTDANAHKGDLLIATGTETDGVLSSITWTYVPSGDDAKLDTTYDFDGDATSNSMTFRAVSSLDGPQGVVGKISFKAGTASTVSSVVSGTTADKNEQLEVTVGHAAVDHTDATGSAIDLNESAEMNVITGVEVNTEGHVTQVTTSKVSAPRYTLGAAPSLVASTAGVQTAVTIKQGIRLGAGEIIPQTVGYKLQSDSLKVSVVTNDGKQNVQIDCVWGDF